MSEFIQDIRYAGRSVVKNPGFALVVILTIGLGIGANSAIFSVVDGVLLRPLPYASPEALHMVWENDRLRGTTQEGFSGPDFFDVAQRNHVFDAMAAYTISSFTLTDVAGEAERVRGIVTSFNLFDVLGQQPARGRMFVAEDGRPGSELVTVISYDLWTSRFGSDESILGRVAMLEGNAYRIVGVAPAGFDFPREPDLWIPWQATPTSTPRGNHGYAVVARAKPGVSLAQINDDVGAIAAALEEEYPDDNMGRGMWAQTMYDAVVGNVRPALLVLLGAVGLVLVIACVNVANLLFARGSVREREIAIRVAMGAGRSRVVRQLLTESVVLAGLGGLVGVVLAVAGVKLLTALGPSNLPRLSNVRVDLRILGFTALVSVATGVLFGLIPSLHASKPDLQGSLKESGAGAGGRSGTPAGSKQRLRRVLVVSEVALAVVLVTAAGLLMRSFWQLQQVDSGFDPRGVMALNIQLPAARYPQNRDDWPDFPEVRLFQQQLLAQVSGLTGVRSAALALNTPTGAGWTTRFTIAGRPPVPPGEQDEIRIRVVSPGYFETVRIPLVRGRALTRADDRIDAAAVLLVNEAMVNRYFPDEEPLGKFVSLWGVDREIVGIVKDVRFMGPTRDAEPAVYPTFSQMPFAAFSLLVRADGDPLALVPQVRQLVREMDGDLALSNITTLDALVDGAVAQPRFNMLLLSIFAGVALALATVGIYGVIAYGVNQRVHEIGIRMSLGARSGDVVRQIVIQALQLAGVGVVVGLVGALWATRFLASLLFGVGAFDAGTFGAVAVVSVAVALVASSVPALRASQIDPVEALRGE